VFVCAGKWLACQSMDNQIVVFNALNHFKFMRKKVFKGHMVAGYACGLDFSPEMRYCTHIMLDVHENYHVHYFLFLELFS